MLVGPEKAIGSIVVIVLPDSGMNRCLVLQHVLYKFCLLEIG